MLLDLMVGANLVLNHFQRKKKKKQNCGGLRSKGDKKVSALNVDAALEKFG